MTEFIPSKLIVKGENKLPKFVYDAYICALTQAKIDIIKIFTTTNSKLYSPEVSARSYFTHAWIYLYVYLC